MSKLLENFTRDMQRHKRHASKMQCIAPFCGYHAQTSSLLTPQLHALDLGLQAANLDFQVAACNKHKKSVSKAASQNEREKEKSCVNMGGCDMLAHMEPRR